MRVEGHMFSILTSSKNKELIAITTCASQHPCGNRCQLYKSVTRRDILQHFQRLLFAFCCSMATSSEGMSQHYNELSIFMCMCHSTDYYVPSKRSSHSTHIVGDYLYMWGGAIDGLPKVHDNEVKMRMTSFIEIFHLPSGRWEQRPTVGKPPLGVIGYASTAIGNKIYYFGGDCNHTRCYHNSVNSLSTDSLTWNELIPTNSLSDECPMMKAECGMISLTFNKEDHLLVIGGFGPYPCPQQRGAGYIIVNDTHAYTNESHYYQLTSGTINTLYHQCNVYKVQFYNCFYFRSLGSTKCNRSPSTFL